MLAGKSYQCPEVLDQLELRLGVKGRTGLPLVVVLPTSQLLVPEAAVIRWV